jgi:hypothetical protein
MSTPLRAGWWEKVLIIFPDYLVCRGCRLFVAAAMRRQVEVTRVSDSADGATSPPYQSRNWADERGARHELSERCLDWLRMIFGDRLPLARVLDARKWAQGLRAAAETDSGARLQQGEELTRLGQGSETDRATHLDTNRRLEHEGQARQRELETAQGWSGLRARHRVCEVAPSERRVLGSL